MKGLCSSSFDAYYGWPGKVIGWEQKYEIYGYENSYLTYDYAKNNWKIGIYGNSYTFAINNDTDDKSVLPIGTKNWYIFNETCNNEGKMSVRKAKLSLSRCSEDEFSCQNDGTW